MNDSQPVFAQLVEIIENDILNGVYTENELIIPTTQISKLYAVNPSPAVKAVAKLTEGGLLYKKPGIGICVAEGARDKIFHRRRDMLWGERIDTLWTEAKNLGILVDEITQTFKKEGTGR